MDEMTPRVSGLTEFANPMERLQPTHIDLAEWLASVPFTEQLWLDIHACGVQDEMALDALPEVVADGILPDVVREGMLAYFRTLDTVLSRAWMGSTGPLNFGDTAVLAAGIQLGPFLETDSGGQLRAWLAGRLVRKGG